MRDGLRIYTTIDSRMQKYAEEAVVQHMPVIQRKLDAIMKYNGTKMWKGHEATIESAMKFTERWKSMTENGIKEEDIKKTFYTPVKMRVFAWNAKREKAFGDDSEVERILFYMPLYRVEHYMIEHMQKI